MCDLAPETSEYHSSVSEGCFRTTYIVGVQKHPPPQKNHKPSCADFWFQQIVVIQANNYDKDSENELL